MPTVQKGFAHQSTNVGRGNLLWGKFDILTNMMEIKTKVLDKIQSSKEPDKTADKCSTLKKLRLLAVMQHGYRQ